MNEHQEERRFEQRSNTRLLFSRQRLTCRICVKVTVATESPLFSVVVEYKKKKCISSVTLLEFDCGEEDEAYSLRPCQESTSSAAS